MIFKVPSDLLDRFITFTDEIAALQRELSNETDYFKQQKQSKVIARLQRQRNLFKERIIEKTECAYKIGMLVKIYCAHTHILVGRGRLNRKVLYQKKRYVSFKIDAFNIDEETLLFDPENHYFK